MYGTFYVPHNVQVKDLFKLDGVLFADPAETPVAYADAQTEIAKAMKFVSAQ